MYTQSDFLRLLFDDGEQTCFAGNPYGISVHPVIEEYQTGQGITAYTEFFSINPLHTDRRDANVTCYRNILLELDTMPLDQQIQYVLSKVPVSSIVYSGGKSFHFIISLHDPCATEEEYRDLVERIHNAVPGVDKACKNPSRLSRLPGVRRASTNQEQRLVQLNRRYSRAELEQYLPRPRVEAVPTAKSEAWTSTDLLMLINKAVVEPNATMAIIGCEGRNAFFFWLGQRMLEAGFDIAKRRTKVEAAYRHLRDKSRFSLREAKHAARIRL